MGESTSNTIELGPTAILFGGLAQFPGVARGPQGSDGRQLLEMASSVLGEDVLASETPGDARRLLISTIWGLWGWRRLEPTLVGPLILTSHSVGVYAALAASGLITEVEAFEATLASAMACESQGPVGDLIGVVGLSSNIVESQCLKFHSAAIASTNGPSHTLVGVVAAEREALRASLLDVGAFSVRPLGLSRPYHTWHLSQSADIFERHLQGIEPREARHPMLVGWPDGAEWLTSRGWVDTVALQLAQAIAWPPIVAALNRENVSRAIQVGPSVDLLRMSRRAGAIFTLRG